MKFCSIYISAGRYAHQTYIRKIYISTKDVPAAAIVNTYS